MESGARDGAGVGRSPPHWDAKSALQLGATAGGNLAGKTKAGAQKGRKKKVLILMSDTGGGHRASAQALEAAFNELFPDQVGGGRGGGA
jgi:hypothetical protein